MTADQRGRGGVVVFVVDLGSLKAGGGVAVLAAK